MAAAGRRGRATRGTGASGASTGRALLVALLAVEAALLAAACSGSGGSGESSDVRAGAAGASSSDAGHVVDDGKRREIGSGDDGSATAGEIVATTPDEWNEKWTASGATGSAPDVSDVDFEKEVAVALFAGERPTGGWRIGPDVSVRVQGQFGAVIYEILGPGDGCSSTQAMTKPYLALAVTTPNLRFESSERKVNCD